MQKVSVIVPVYNGGKYVEKCIERLLDEKEFLHEIIFVNDGSKDNTKALLEKYSSLEKVRVISQENKGVSAARNRGMDASTGEWLVFCDIDDEIKEGYFKDIANSLEEKRDVDLLCFGKVGNADTETGERDFDKKKAFFLSIGCDVDNYLNDYIFMSVWSKVFRRNIISSRNIRFNESISYAEDVLFLLEYLIYANRIDLVRRGYYHYLPNEEGACMHGGSIKDYDGFFIFDKEMRRIVEAGDSLLNNDDFYVAINQYMFALNRIMCGRVVRGTVNDRLSERCKLVKSICKKAEDYISAVSVKEKLILAFKKYFTAVYILSSNRK